MTDLDSRRPELRPGSRVGLYEVVSQIGTGGYADVYKVKREHRFYALKLARVRGDGDPESDATRSDRRLVRESACLRLIDAPGVVRIYDSGRWPDVEKGWFYLVLELVEGAPLHVWLRYRTPSPRQIARTFAKLARAVHALHQHHIFHRDLKSQNVLVSGTGEVTVIDLSVALMPTLPHLTEEGTMPGTRTHLSPEVFKYLHDDESLDEGHFPYKATADLHTIGYLLYQALTGRPPFDTHKPRHELYEQIKEKVPDRPREINPRAPEVLEALAMRLLEKEPERRPQTGLEVAEALEAEAALADNSWDRPLEVPPWEPGKVAEPSESEWAVPVHFGDDAAQQRKEIKPPKPRHATAIVAGALAVCLAPVAYLALGSLLPRRVNPAASQAPSPVSAEIGQAGVFEPFTPKLSLQPLAWLPAEARSPEGGAVRTATSRPSSPPRSLAKPGRAARRDKGNEPSVVARVAPICAALLAACPGAQHRPDGLPTGLTCPPKASQPLGVKAMPDRPLTASFMKIPGREDIHYRKPDIFKCRGVGYEDECSWIREGKVEARADGWPLDPEWGPAIIPPPATLDTINLWGEARADGDRFYIIFTHLRLPDGRVVPLCGLSHDGRANQAHPLYYKILKRENGRFKIDGAVNEANIYLLEDF